MYNGSGIPGLATSAASQLRRRATRPRLRPTPPSTRTASTVVYAPKSLETQARIIGELLWPSDVRIVERAFGVDDGITVFVASSFDGTIEAPEEQVQAQQTLQQRPEVRLGVVAGAGREEPAAPRGADRLVAGPHLR